MATHTEHPRDVGRSNCGAYWFSSVSDPRRVPHGVPPTCVGCRWGDHRREALLVALADAETSEEAAATLRFARERGREQRWGRMPLVALASDLLDGAAFRRAQEAATPAPEQP
jgi:hypothetical protein